MYAGGRQHQSIRYPILPRIRILPADESGCDDCDRELYRIHHHSLFTQLDFDASPYFEIVKPSLVEGVDYRHIEWED